MVRVHLIPTLATVMAPTVSLSSQRPPKVGFSLLHTHLHRFVRDEGPRCQEFNPECNKAAVNVNQVVYVKCPYEMPSVRLGM